MISNRIRLATTNGRSTALLIAEAAYAAIDTKAAVSSKLSIEDETLYAGDRSFPLSEYKRVMVVGFGKASCSAVESIESILKKKITQGVAIDIRAGTCEIVDVVSGTHPMPSQGNVDSTRRIIEMTKECKEDDLIIVVVSGGGSSLLCWPYDECEQGMRLYQDLLHTGATIGEMNTVRKHISAVKGGGLASLFHPATVISLVFCDVAGGHFEDVASGPTYYDKSTIADAQTILDKYHLTGYTLLETPKDESLFKRVHNIPVISNTEALDAMEKRAKELGYSVTRLGGALYDTPKDLMAKMRAAATKKSIIIAGGEPSLVVTKKGGKGGRCQYCAVQAMVDQPDGETFMAFASDGRDNSDTAGAIADSHARTKATELGLDPHTALEDFDTYHFLEKLESMIMTGPTDANVADLFLLVQE